MRNPLLQLHDAQIWHPNFPILLAAKPTPDFSRPHVTAGTLRKTFG